VKACVLGVTILLFRLVSCFLEIVLWILRGRLLSSLGSVIDVIHRHEFIIIPAISVSVSVVVHQKLRKHLAGKAPNMAVVILVWILALFPLHYENRFLIDLTVDTTVPHETAERAQPISLECRLTGGEESEVIIASADIVRAESIVSPLGNYSVRLYLNKEGQTRVAQATKKNAGTGRRLAFSINGDSQYVAEILAPITGAFIVVPKRFSREEADRIAGGINASRRASQELDVP